MRNAKQGNDLKQRNTAVLGDITFDLEVTLQAVTNKGELNH